MLERWLSQRASSCAGPCLFLSCPMDVEGSQVWFTDLWNYSIIPYMLEAVREGLQVRTSLNIFWKCKSFLIILSNVAVSINYPVCVMQLYGRKAAWEDPSLWVLESYPWPSCLQQLQCPLLQLRREDVGFDGFPREPGTQGTEIAPDGAERDPLVRL